MDAKAFRSHTIDSQEQEIIALEPGSRLEREIFNSQKHTYRITLAEGQYASVIVEQRGIDVLARLFGADEKLIFEFDTEIRGRSLETPEIVAETSGSYRLEIEPRYKLLLAGRYEIRLNDLRAATEKDRSLQRARRLYAEVLRQYTAAKFEQVQPLIEQAWRFAPESWVLSILKLREH